MEVKQSFADNKRERDGGFGRQGDSEGTILRGGIDYLSGGAGVPTGFLEACVPARQVCRCYDPNVCRYLTLLSSFWV